MPNRFVSPRYNADQKLVYRGYSQGNEGFSQTIELFAIS